MPATKASAGAHHWASACVVSASMERAAQCRCRATGDRPRVTERGCYDAAAATRRDGRHERMSQIDVATKSPIRQRTQGLRSRIEVFVRNFEWTWTNAVLFSMALLFFL